MIEFKGKPSGEIHMKRDQLEGLIFEKQTCPECKHETEWEEVCVDNLNYTRINEQMPYFLYCDECDHKWIEEVVLKVELANWEPIRSNYRDWKQDRDLFFKDYRE